MIKLAYSDRFIYALPEGHRFPIEKYQLVKEQLLHEGTIEAGQLFDPGLASEEQILAVHTVDYWNKLKSLQLDQKSVRSIGLPVNETSIKRARNSVAGTIAAANHALNDGLGINLAGGTHHAYADYGEGFCVLNDIAISARELLAAHKIRKALVVDLDVHQGNGTAKIFQNDHRVFTFSMHGEHNYPLHKENSDFDIALPQGSCDDKYLQLLASNLPKLIAQVRPDIVYYQAGVDIMKEDRLGKLALTKAGVKKRDEIVLRSCFQNDIPVTITMGGGYTKELKDLIDAHCNTVRMALSIYM
ncbi:MAG: histone deacetylase [Fulvivirga sp.]|nr:histone deacetylase [Fulvivirga sp.]